jgi:DNA polymerase-4
VKIKFADFHQVTRSRSLPTPVDRRDLLRQLSVDLVRTVLPVAKGVRLIGVTLSNFDKRPTMTATELPLFHLRQDE